MELVGDDDESEHQEASAEWVNLIDRGGLWHVSIETFMFFCAIEEELRRHLKMSAVKELSGGLKDRIRNAIITSDDVNFTGACYVQRPKKRRKKHSYP